jgi:anaerobic ribonucleoside-triphosphate reductase activating protein
MNYAKIRNYDIANGEGIRTSLFVSGCTNHCQGCFNEEAQDFNYGLPYIPETEQTILKQISKPYVAGLSILGGDPLCQNNSGLTLLIELTNAVHDLGKTVWLWTGFVWEDLDHIKMNLNKALIKTLLYNCDVVVDGPFKMELSDRMLKWRGSANQRVIDVQKTLRQKKIVLYEGGHYE